MVPLLSLRRVDRVDEHLVLVWLAVNRNLMNGPPAGGQQRPPRLLGPRRRYLLVGGRRLQGGSETMTLEAIGGKTKITARSHMGSIETLEGALATGTVGGAIETWDRLEAVLAEG